MQIYAKNRKSKAMKDNKKEYKEAENKEFTPDEGPAVNNGPTPCDGEACANMADACDEMAAEATNAPEENSPQYEAALWKEKYTRLSAEYENYRKRTFKEKMDIVAAGGEDVVRSMLEVLDDLDRALAAIAKTDDLEAVKQGIQLIDNKLRGALKGKGLAEIEAIGNELDTDLHEAVARIETQEKELKGKVIDVVQKGYKLKDKIIRYAKVVVGQ